LREIQKEDGTALGCLGCFLITFFGGAILLLLSVGLMDLLSSGILFQILYIALLVIPFGIITGGSAFVILLGVLDILLSKPEPLDLD